MRILISGVSGAGKTTLANFLAREYNLEFVQGSTKIFWEKYGIKSHEQLIKKTINDIDWGLQFQYECLKYRMDNFNKDNIVSDRGVIDNIVYFLTQVTPFCSESITQDYIDTANKFLKETKCLTLLLGMPDNLENDGMRINNRIYQETSLALFEYVRRNQIIPQHTVRFVHQWDWYKRMYEVKHIIFHEAL